MTKREIADWWSNNPMTYGMTHGKTGYEDDQYDFGSKEFFERVDKEFYSWNQPLHSKNPFDRLFPYADYVNKHVLEVGCGMGTMSMNWARSGAIVTAVDLNPVAVAQTRSRFKIYELEGNIKQADANNLGFEDHAFDYVWSWGVLHHSPDLEKSLAEVMRVLKPGGGFGIMLYDRQSILHWYETLYIEGFLHFENNFLGPLELASRYGDAGREEGNPHTWPVTKSEITASLKSYSSDLELKKLGTDLDYAFRHLLPGLGLFLPTWAKKPWARRFGWSLWISGHKDS